MISDTLVKIAKGDLITEEEKKELVDWASSVQDVPELIAEIFKGTNVIENLAKLSSDLGAIKAGTFSAGNDGDPEDASGNNTFSGVQMKYPGLSVDSGTDEAAIFGMNNGVLSFWISALTGKIYAGAGSVTIDEDGIKTYNGLLNTGSWEADGDFSLGSDLSAPGTTTFKVFTVAQTYNSESFGAGDILIGDNTTATPNVLYDASSEQLQFRYGSTVNVYMNTDGTLKAGAGAVTLDANGVSILSDFSIEDYNKIRFVKSNGDEVFYIAGSVVDGNETNMISNVSTGAAEVNIEAGDAKLRLASGGTYVPSGPYGREESAFITGRVYIGPTISADSQGLIINENGEAEYDVRMEGDTDANLFYLDTSTDRIGIGDSTPSYKLDVAGDINTTGAFRVNGIVFSGSSTGRTDQSGGTSDTYGALSGTINGSNTTFTVSAGTYTSGTLRVYLNGQLQTQGSSEDWVETAPASGTFDFNTAPVSGDEITAFYGAETVGPGTSIVNISGVNLTGSINSSNQDFTTSQAYISGTLIVYRNGQLLTKDVDWTETTPASGTFQMTVAPTTGDTLTAIFGLSLTSISGYLADDGWIPVSDTWTRTGNYTFTVSGDVTADPNYQRGIKVKYNDGSVDYGVIHSTSYSAPNTTVTLITNSDYAMAAATITGTYISKIESPDGFPEWFNWSPTVTGFTIGNGTLTTKWKSRGGTNLFLSIYFILGSTSAITGDIRVSVPATEGFIQAGTGQFVDAGVQVYIATVSASIGIILIRATRTSGTYADIVVTSATVPFTWGTGDIFTATVDYVIA